MVRTVLALSTLAIGITAVSAQSDPYIARRKAIMKELGAQVRTGASMAKGEAPYDQAKARAVFATFRRAAEEAPNLFPPTSKSGGDTAALPAIWANKADFDSRFRKFAYEAGGLEYQVKELDGFKAGFTNVVKNCGGCHETYRAKKS